MSAQISLERRVGELVAEDFRNAHVFSRFGIDFCCGGGRSLASACERAGAEPTEVLHALSQLAAEGTPDDALAKLPLGELIEHIEATHHKYIRDTAPLLLEYAQ